MAATMSFFDRLPPSAGAGAARESMLLDAVKEGIATFEWSTLEAGTVTLRVMRDALRIEGVRINVNADTQQRIADELGGMLLTPRISDLVFEKADVVIKPAPRPITATTASMIAHSHDVDARIAGRAGLVSTVGKDWVLVNAIAGRRDKAANYGWHFRGERFEGIRGERSVSLADVRVIQGVGTRHDPAHTDYSQVCRLVDRRCRVDGEARDLAGVLREPGLAPFVSHEGPLRLDRMPGVALPGSPQPAHAPVDVSTLPVLRRGSRGDAVAWWQNVIGVDADGRFGPVTDAATRQWQSGHGLVADGVVGPETWAVAVEEAGSPPA